MIREREKHLVYIRRELSKNITYYWIETGETLGIK